MPFLAEWIILETKERNTLEKVEPIRTKEKLEEMKQVLRKKGEKYYILFLVGINTSLRVSDLRTLTVGRFIHLDDEEENPEFLKLREQKTKKKKIWYINPVIQKEVTEYAKKYGLTEADYLCPSKKDKSSPIGRVQFYRIIHEAGEEIGLDNLGTHTCRKTFGYFHYQAYKDIAILQKLYNHSSPSITLEYLCINEDMIKESLKDFVL